MGQDKLEKATFAAGCFWGVEELFRNTAGVKTTAVGYTGGWLKNPSYTFVCTSMTGHAEAVQIEFDPKEVPYSRLLELFWENHDPTTGNRQGLDIGTQYRSAIFFYSEEQERLALESKRNLESSGRFKKPITTQIVPAQTFWKAEEYHQKYLQKKGAKTCH